MTLILNLNLFSLPLLFVDSHQAMELLCGRATSRLRHCQLSLVWKCAEVSQKQQHLVREAGLISCMRVPSLLHVSYIVPNSTVGLLWISKRKCGIRSVTTLTAGTSGPPVSSKPQFLLWLCFKSKLDRTCLRSVLLLSQVTLCHRRSASATSWPWLVSVFIVYSLP